MPDTWKGITKFNDIEVMGNAALTYARAGIPVFPVFSVIAVEDDRAGREGQQRWVCTCSEGKECTRSGKHPLVKWREAATADEEKVTELWQKYPGANIGMPTGEASGMVAIDLDVREIENGGEDGMTEHVNGEAVFGAWYEKMNGPGESLETLTQKTGGGGKQLLVLDPGAVPTGSDWMTGVDLRGDGGYIILPPSRSGKGRYQWHNELAPATVDERFARTLRETRGSGGSLRGNQRGTQAGNGSGPGGGAGNSGYDYARAKESGPPIGSRDTFFNAYAFELRGLDWPWDWCEEELKRVWKLTPQGNKDEGGTGATGADGGVFTWEMAREKLVRVWSTVPAPSEERREQERQDRERERQGRTTRGEEGERSTERPALYAVPDQGENPGGWHARQGEDEEGRQGREGEDRGETRGEDGAGGGGGGGGGGGRGERPRYFADEYPRHLEVYSDLGNSYRFARVLGNEVRFHHGLGWFIWDGKVFRKDTDKAVMDLATRVIDDLYQLARELPDEPDNDPGGGANSTPRSRCLAWAMASQHAARINAMLMLAESRRSLVVGMDDLDADPYLLCCQNGVVDLRTGELKEHDPRYLMTQITNVDYVPERGRDKESFLLDEFHETFLPDERYRDFLYMAVGNTLVARNPQRVFLFITGPTTTGKSQWTSTVIATLGGYAAETELSVFRGAMEDKPRTDLIRVLPKRLVVAEEMSSTLELHGDWMKRITGGATFSPRGMRSGMHFDMRAEFTPLFVTNQMPRIKGVDSAIKRRIIALPFNQALADNVRENTSKKVRFFEDQKVREGILARLVQGAVACYRDGIELNDVSIAAVNEATAQAFDDADDVNEFLEWAYAVGRLAIVEEDVPMSNCVTVTELHRVYIEWVKEHGDSQQIRNRYGTRGFNTRLESMGWEKRKSGGPMRWLRRQLRNW